jgi:hypothetical protein
VSDTTIVLSRAESLRLADAWEPLVRQFGSRERTAKETRISENLIQKAVSRAAVLRITRASLTELGAAVGLDTKGWGA